MSLSLHFNVKPTYWHLLTMTVCLSFHCYIMKLRYTLSSLIYVALSFVSPDTFYAAEKSKIPFTSVVHTKLASVCEMCQQLHYFWHLCNRPMFAEAYSRLGQVPNRSFKEPLLAGWQKSHTADHSGGYGGGGELPIWATDRRSLDTTGQQYSSKIIRPTATLSNLLI